MFEGTLAESRGLVGTGTARWTALGSLVLQCALAALLFAIPMLRTQAMPLLANAPKLAVPQMSKPPVRVVKIEQAASSASALMSAPQVSTVTVISAPRLLPSMHGLDDPGPAPTLDSNLEMGGTGGGPLSALVMGDGRSSVPVVAAKRSGPVRVSSGVSAGMLLSEIRPVYPAIARAARVEGTVVMQATISKTGTTESLHAVSGPEMLRGAALDAAQAARYEPYKLNGEATEVQTTITVVFRLGS